MKQGTLELAFLGLSFMALQAWWIRMTIKNGASSKIDGYLQKEQLSKQKQRLEKLLNKFKFDLIVVSDYRKGTLQNSKNFIKLANKFKIPVLVDPKGEDFSIYKGAYLIKPNLQEFQTKAQP